MLSSKRFPFCPEVPWKIYSKGIVSPKLSNVALNKLIANKDVVVATNGGFIESLTSLSFFEMVNFYYPTKKMYWSGNPNFNYLSWVNGLSNISNVHLSLELLEDYPTSIFLDKDNHLFFNCLNNYLTIKSYDKTYQLKNKSALLSQILKNLTQPWDENFIPKFRNLIKPIEVTKWEKLCRFYPNQPYVCLFPDWNSGFSIHSKKRLNWTPKEVKALFSLLRSAGINLILFTNNHGRYPGCLFTLPLKLDFFLPFLINAKAVLAEETDFLLAALLLSNAGVAAIKRKSGLNLQSNVKFLKKQNVIYTGKRKLNPVEVFEFIKRL
jgi:hypothetical protein